ncbi:YdbH family protein [Mannheimia granulomatis]|uniref:YdbH family protein n=1 Tax=Mannheimia granulomatis TaxID=85402 RepID=UPI000E3F2778|nr:YdbH family protein [Mannheimia granulomatis]
MMKRTLGILGILAVMLMTAIAVLMSGSMLGTTLNWLLPKGWQIQLTKGLTPGWQKASLPYFKLSYQNCPLISVDNSAVTWIKKQHLSIENIKIDYQCLPQLLQTQSNHSGTSLKALLALIPNGEASIHALTWVNLPENLSPRLTTLLSKPTAFHIASLNQSITASLQQQAVKFSANFANEQLNTELTYRPNEKEQHKLNFSAQLKDDLSQLPPQLSAKYQWQLSDEIISNAALQNGTSTLTWQQNTAQQLEGNWQLNLASSENDKFDFPFLFDGKNLEIKQGRFDWSLIEQFPFHGFISAKFTPETLQLENLFPIKTAVRISLLSQNRWGKGNIVISSEGGEVNQESLTLPIRLTGNIKHGNFILYSSIPLDLQGKFDDLRLKFLPSSLLRLTGKERYLTIEDLRFPLAGLQVDKYGIHGRLYAILKGESPDFKNINFHLDGYANNFKAGALDFFQNAPQLALLQDNWSWRIWGNSTLKAFNSKVNLNGRGQWHKNSIQLTEFKGDLSEIKLDDTIIPKTELTLNDTIKFDTTQNTLKGEIKLKSPEIRFSYGGNLPKPEAKLAFNGRTENLNFKGIINTTELGPLKLFARRQLTEQSSQIVGKLYWPEQSARGFQPLFPFRSQWIIKQGTIRGETAFSASIKNGLIAGGHLAIRNGGISLPNGEATGIEFALPYRYRDGHFHFGVKKPIAVNIAQIKLGDLALDKISMKINGYYPYNKTKPLNLNELTFKLFGGNLNIKRFSLPQTELAYLNLERIDFEELLNFIQYQQIDLKGKANATLPFWLSGKPCYICDGLLTQAQTSYLTFTPELLAAMGNSGYTEQILLHLVDKSKINDFRSLINVGPSGDLVLDGKLKLSSNQGESKVNLNYNHRENMFDLWDLINYGSQFEQKLENYLYQKLEK